MTSFLTQQYATRSRKHARSNASEIKALVTLTILRAMIEPATDADAQRTAAATPTVAAVSVKLPPFWPQDPRGLVHAGGSPIRY